MDVMRSAGLSGKGGRLASLGLLAAVALAALSNAAAASDLPKAAPAGERSVGPSGLQLPRYVSLKSDRVNLRVGPGTDYKIGWVFRKVGMPVEVVREYEGWRQVRDSEGATGWVLATMLSGRRTAVVLPWEAAKAAGKGAQPAGEPQTVSLHADDRSSSRVLAYVEPGVIASLLACDGRWCRISVNDVRGYIEQKLLWGVDVGEVVK